MLRQAFDRSRLAELARHQHRIAADKRRKRDFVHRRNERDRKEEIEDKAEAAVSAMAAVAFSPPATAQQIAAFEADLTLYDTATVDALMANDLQLEKVRGELQVLLSQAFVMEDGRRVFRTEDGTQVFDEFGEEIGSDEIEPATIPDHHPTWEQYAVVRDQYAALQMEREALINFQEQLDEARDALAEGEICRHPQRHRVENAFCQFAQDICTRKSRLLVRDVIQDQSRIGNQLILGETSAPFSSYSDTLKWTAQCDILA